MKVFEKEEFQKKAVRWMVGKGQWRRKLDQLMSDITGGEDWWPKGLPQLPVNRSNRQEYVKQEWSGGLVRYGKKYYRIVIESVLLGRYYVARLGKVWDD